MINGGGPPAAAVEDEGYDSSFLSGYNASDLRIASEFLSNWLPFLSKGLCQHCSNSLFHRVHSLNHFEYATEQPHQQAESHVSTPNHTDLKDETYMIDNEDTNSLGSWKDGAYGVSGHIEETSGSERVQSPEYFKTPAPRKSWADMAQEELEADEEEEAREHFGNSNGRLQGKGEVRTAQKLELSREQRERIRFTNVTRKKDFICLERVKGKPVNILEGLELHCGVFSLVEQKKIVNFVYELQEKGKNGKLKERTFTAPQKWMKGKGRVTIQFGCCYNYATDRNGNPPGILHNELVDPIPHLFKVIIKRLVAWHVLPPTCVPDSCIVNIYDEGDCIPPHIDNHDFIRPFCTVSFLSECDILFGSNLKIEGPGEFSGSYKIPLPVGSVLVLNGNGADVAKHCVPAVPTKRISITFRKMDESKWPAGFHPEPDLQGLEPLVYESDTPKSGSNISKPHSQSSNRHAFRRDGSVAETDLRGLEPVAYESDRPKSGSSISKPHSHLSNRQDFSRDRFAPEPDLRGLEPVAYESDRPKSGSSISKPHSHLSNRQDFRRDGFAPEPDLRGLEPVAYESDRPKSGSSISKPHSHLSNRQNFRRDGFAPEPDLRGLEPVAYESDRPKSGSSISKPHSHLSNRQDFRRDGFAPEPDLRGLEPVAYESDRPKSGSSISKPQSHLSNRQNFRRDGFAPEPDLRGLEPVAYESDRPKSGLIISKPNSQFSKRQAFRKDGFVAEPDLRRLEPVAYESDRPKSVSSISKPHIHPSNREPNGRDDARGLQGSQPRFYGQSQTRQQGPSPGYRRNGRLEY